MFRVPTIFASTIVFVAVISLTAATSLATSLLDPICTLLAVTHMPATLISRTAIVVSVTFQTAWHKEMMLSVRLPPLNRPQPQNLHRPLVHDGDPRPKFFVMPITRVDIICTPHALISVAHLMQQRADHTLKGSRRLVRPPFLEYHARVQIDPTLSFLGPVTIANTPCSEGDLDVGAPSDYDIFAESAGEEDNIEVGEGFYGDVRTEDESVLRAGGGGQEVLDGGFFVRGGGALGVVMPHDFLGGLVVRFEGAFVGGWEFFLSVEIDVGLAAGVGCTRVFVEGFQGLLE